MKILFLSIVAFDITRNGIYTDLMKCFKEKGHDIYVVSPRERKYGKNTEYVSVEGINILNVKIGNMTKVNIIEKGLSTLFIEYQYLNAINKYLKNINFDIVIYSTPPITFAKIIKNIKKRYNAKSYLLL